MADLVDIEYTIMADAKIIDLTVPPTTALDPSERRYWKNREPAYESDDSESDFGFEEEFELRDYQADAIIACDEALKNGLTRIGVSAPTGSGKTVMFSSLIPRVPDRKRRTQVLIIVHTEELATQASTTIEQMHDHRYRVGIEQGGQRTDGRRDV